MRKLARRSEKPDRRRAGVSNLKQLLASIRRNEDRDCKRFGARVRLVALGISRLRLLIMYPGQIKWNRVISFFLIGKLPIAPDFKGFFSLRESIARLNFNRVNCHMTLFRHGNGKRSKKIRAVRVHGKRAVFSG